MISDALDFFFADSRFLLPNSTALVQTLLTGQLPMKKPRIEHELPSGRISTTRPQEQHEIFRGASLLWNTGSTGRSKLWPSLNMGYKAERWIGATALRFGSSWIEHGYKVEWTERAEVWRRV